jgi:hypothetical protein
MDANKIELEIAEFSLRTQVTAMFRELAARANKNTVELAIDIDIDIDIDDDVPDRLLGDVGRFRQVLSDLLDQLRPMAGKIVQQVATVSIETLAHSEAQLQDRRPGSD